MFKVDDVENEKLNVLEVIVGHHIDEHIEDDTLCRLNVDSKLVETLVVRHVIDDFINDDDEKISPQSGSSDNE